MRSTNVGAILIAAALAFAIGLSLDAPQWMKTRADPVTASPQPSVADQRRSADAGAAFESDSSIADIGERVVISVVNISSEKVVHATGGAPDFGPFSNDPFFRHFFFGPGLGQPSVPREQRERSLGSGVIVDPKGIIITNNHVIENASEITVPTVATSTQRSWAPIPRAISVCCV